MVKYGIKFEEELESLLADTFEVTPEMFRASIPDDNWKERLSLKRCKLECRKRNWHFERVLDNSSVTDVIINGLKVQMKYVGSPTNTEKGYAHRLQFKRCSGKSWYKQGDNDLYIIEIESNHGDFMILTEALMIEHGFIETSTKNIRTTSISVYHPEFKKIKNDEYKNIPENKNKKDMFRANWTENPIYWILQDNDYIGHETHPTKTLHEYIKYIDNLK